MAPHSPSLHSSDDEELDHPLKGLTSHDDYASTLSLSCRVEDERRLSHQPELDLDEGAGLLGRTRRDSNEEEEEAGEESVGQGGGELAGGHSPIAGASARCGAKPLRGSFAGGRGKRGERRAFFVEMATQTFPVLLLALLGAALTGVLLERVQSWPVFIRIEELFILVPILLNLKGNIEGNLSARFSTSANIGELDLRSTRNSLIRGNLSLLQVQALIVSLFSGLLGFALGSLSRNGMHHALQHPAVKQGQQEIVERGGYFEALLVLSASMLAASLSSAILGSFTCGVIVLARKFRYNPDNFAIPLAACLSDLLTLSILAGVSVLLRHLQRTLFSTAIFLLLLLFIALNTLIVFRNAYVQELLFVGFGPLLVAMVISSATGVVLETYVNAFEGFALLATTVTAISGGTGSILVSRLSTSLHSGRKERYALLAGTLWVLAAAAISLCLGVMSAAGAIEGRVALAVGGVTLLGQMPLALLVSYHLTMLLWTWDYDPDIYALPLLTSALDVTGQLMLVGAFMLVGKVDGQAAEQVQAVASAVGSAVASASATATARWVAG